MKIFEKWTMPLGMIGVIAYFTHTILGNILWNSYDPVTEDISSLTAVGAPYRNLLLLFTTVYGVAVILFVIGMIIKSFRKYNAWIRSGWIILLIMNLVSLFGYALFPLTGNKTEMNFQNSMHIIITAIVVFTTIVSGFILAAGYLKNEKTRRLGKFILLMAFVITATGAMNPIAIANHLNILGLTERLVIYSLQFMLFVLSAYYTFSKDEKSSPTK